jgi:hypothetical protein
MKSFTVTISCLLIVLFVLSIDGCRQKPNITFIKQKLNDFDDVDTFVTWLETQAGITSVTHDKRIFLTSNPPKQVVTFFLSGVEHRFLLIVDIDAKIRIIKPTLEDLDRIKNSESQSNS